MNIKKGFTLIELMVVVGIIGALVAIIAPTSFKALEKSKVTVIEADYRAIKTAVMVYYADTGGWPSKGSEEKAFITGDGSTNWGGPYLENWKNENVFGGRYSIISENERLMLEVTKVPTSTVKKLKGDLGTSVVTNGKTSDAVRILITRTN